MSNANSETKEHLQPQQAEMHKMINRSLELLTLTSILTLLTVKAPIAKEDRDPDTRTHYTTGTGLGTLLGHFLHCKPG